MKPYQMGGPPTVSVSLSQALKDAVKQRAEQEGTTQARIVRAAIEQYLKHEKPPQESR